MKNFLSSHGLFLLGFIILVATNIAVLSGVASNRSGEPESQITLTQRELELPYQVHEEDSGLSLKLTWQTLDRPDDYNYQYWRTPAWLNVEKLKKLGFNINTHLNSVGNTTFYKQSIPKEVFIVLENDGEAYEKMLKRAAAALERKENSFKLNPGDKSLSDDFESAKKQLQRKRIEETRLFAIDAGLNPGELKNKYRDKSRFIITKGLIKASYDNDKKKVSGYISRLSVTSIHVPLKYRQVFDSILAQEESKENDFKDPRFEVELAYGSRHEPWILSVKTMR
ncbi:MAG: DUF4824 family protein [Desulfobacteraceae bacterium]|nr:DUF4824 family protein [Desulfobacteraceae bacterium]